MEVQIRVKKNAKVFTTICTQNARIIKQIIKSQHINSSGEGVNFCFTSTQLRMVSSTQVLNRANILLQRKEVNKSGNTTKYLYIIRKKEETAMFVVAT
jgi:hypothetical protein